MGAASPNAIRLRGFPIHRLVPMPFGNSTPRRLLQNLHGHRRAASSLRGVKASRPLTAEVLQEPPRSRGIEWRAPLESRRDSALQPRVARHELPWVTAGMAPNPNGVVSRVRQMPQPRWGCCVATPVPRVARASQPWALIWNPVGIQIRRSEGIATSPLCRTMPDKPQRHDGHRGGNACDSLCVHRGSVV